MLVFDDDVALLELCVLNAKLPAVELFVFEAALVDVDEEVDDVVVPTVELDEFAADELVAEDEFCVLNAPLVESAFELLLLDACAVVSWLCVKASVVSNSSHGHVLVIDVPDVFTSVPTESVALAFPLVTLPPAAPAPPAPPAPAVEVTEPVPLEEPTAVPPEPAGPPFPPTDVLLPVVAETEIKFVTVAVLALVTEIEVDAKTGDAAKSRAADAASASTFRMVIFIADFFGE